MKNKNLKRDKKRAGFSYRTKSMRHKKSNNRIMKNKNLKRDKKRAGFSYFTFIGKISVAALALVVLAFAGHRALNVDTGAQAPAVTKSTTDHPDSAQAASGAQAPAVTKPTTDHPDSAQAASELRLNVIGFTDTHGGRGGKVIRVTNLESEGPGSLRAAVEAKGPRIVVFEVGGVIDLNKKMLNITNPFLTIAGQTAPSPGITIIRGGISIKSHDIVIRHIRVRPGDAGEPKKSGWEVDGINSWGRYAYNIIVDHCSVSWATDENMGFSGSKSAAPDRTSRKVTVSNCIISEGLSYSTHHKGEHSKGMLIYTGCTEFAIIGNLFAHNMCRHPYIQQRCSAVIVNNLVYNAGKKPIFLGGVTRVSIVGNIGFRGPNSERNLPLLYRGGRAYLEDNHNYAIDGSPARLKDDKVIGIEEKRIWPEGLEPLPSSSVVDYLVRNAGARPKDRDETDKRIIREVLERKGRIINSQEDVGGYPTHKVTFRKLTVPANQIDDWLNEFRRRVE